MRHNRTVRVQKRELIDKIKLNQKKHVEEFNKAVESYKLEALEQLANMKAKIDKGEMGIRLDLVVPINRTVEYDKVIEMFNWDVNTVVELTQSEFNEYVHDDNDSARQASLSNSFYSAKFG